MGQTIGSASMLNHSVMHAIVFSRCGPERARLSISSYPNDLLFMTFHRPDLGQSPYPTMLIEFCGEPRIVSAIRNERVHRRRKRKMGKLDGNLAIVTAQHAVSDCLRKAARRVGAKVAVTDLNLHSYEE
jgi:hypothetical protein